MKDSLFLRSITKILFPSLWIFAALLFWRGHNSPGGGFIAGLLVAASFGIVGLSLGAEALRKTYRLQAGLAPVRWGLLLAVGSGFIAMLSNPSNNFFQGAWTEIPIPYFGPLALGSPMLFDLGVFLVVVGIGVNFIISMMED